MYVKKYLTNEAVVDRVRNKEAGISTPNILIGLLILGIITAATVSVLSPQVNAVQMDNAFNELYNINASVKKVKAYTGDYTLLTSFAVLETRGYIEGYTDGVNENEFDQSITAVPANSNRDVTLTYGFLTGEDCLNMVDRVSSGLPGISAQACGGTGNVVLTITID